MADRYTCEKCDQLLHSDDIIKMSKRFIGCSEKMAQMMAEVDTIMAADPIDPFSVKVVDCHIATAHTKTGWQRSWYCGPVRLETQEEYYVRFSTAMSKNGKRKSYL